MQIPSQELWIWAQSPHTPVNILDDILQEAISLLGTQTPHKGSQLLDHLVSNSAITSQQMMEILEVYRDLSGINCIIWEWRNYMHLDKNVLSVMSVHPAHSIRLEAARHPLTDPKDLVLLAHDKRAVIRAAVARQKRLDINTLAQLTKDPKSSVYVTAQRMMRYVPPALRL